MGDGGPATTYALPGCSEGFLTPDECRKLIRDVGAARQEQAEVWVGSEFGIDPASRMGGVAVLPSAAETLVQDRLWGVMPELEERFSCEVSHVSGVTALIYRRGDHFAAHSDGGIDDDSPLEVRRRRVSLVVALNDGARDFSGGELHFYPGSPPREEVRGEPGVRIRSQTGMLIAFASPMVHRVTPVIDGCRYSLALWALAPTA